MQAFDIFLYALAIITVLLLRAEPTPAPVAAEPTAIEDDLPSLPELLTEAADLVAKPAAVVAVAAAIAEPAAVAVVKVEASPENTEAPADLATLKTAELRKLCSQRGITWRNALGANRHLPKAAMVAALAS